MALLDTRISVPRQNRTFIQSVEAICREVSRLRGTPLNGEWGGRTLNVGPDELYWGALLPPYILWGVQDRTAREALVDLIGGSKTTSSWVQTCDRELLGRQVECKVSIVLTERWVDSGGRPVLESVVRDHCNERPDRTSDCAWPVAPPPPPAP